MLHGNQQVKRIPFSNCHGWFAGGSFLGDIFSGGVFTEPKQTFILVLYEKRKIKLWSFFNPKWSIYTESNVPAMPGSRRGQAGFWLAGTERTRCQLHVNVRTNS